MNDNARKWTCRLLDMMDDGVIDPKAVAEMCLAYMSEWDVEDMMRVNDLKEYFREEEEEE